jgi:magnesium chelatase family protein
MLARWLPTVLPAMTLTGDPTAVVTTRPFRSPPPVYGRCGADRRGQVSMPGEVSLAHHGVVCLDELPECRRHGLEVLRQSLEEGVTKSPPPGRR